MTRGIERPLWPTAALRVLIEENFPSVNVPIIKLLWGFLQPRVIVILSIAVLIVTLYSRSPRLSQDY